MRVLTLRVLPLLVLLAVAASSLAASAPVITSFTVSPASPVPGQHVTLDLRASDPDCTAPPCTSACGTAIRSDLLVWTDDTGRATGAFTGSSASPTGSPWSATVAWIAPPAEGTYTVRANVVDNGGMLCGGRQTTVATLRVNVSSTPSPSIVSCEVVPQSVIVGATATITATASDPLGRPIAYAFASDAGSIAHDSPSSNRATWTAPLVAGSLPIRCTASAGGIAATLQTTVTVRIGAFLKMLATAGLRVTRLAALSDGSVALVDGTSGTLARVSPTGETSWRVRGLATPVAVARSESELFVLERDAKRVSVWSFSGTRLRELAIDAVLPNQLIVGPHTGELAFTDTGAARAIVISSRDGRRLRTIGDGKLGAAAGLATDGNRLAIADPSAARVLLFDDTGTPTATLGDGTLLVRPQGLAWDVAGHRLIVADSFSGELAIIGEDNVVRGMLAGFGEGEGLLVNPIDVALLPGGTIGVTTGGGELPLYRLMATLPPLAPPTSLVAADRPDDDGGAIALTWTASSDDPSRVTAYRIERASEEGDSFAVVDSVERSVTSYVDTSVRDGVCHRYRVVATDGSGDAPTGTTPCTVARNDLAPPQPANLTADVVGPFAATFEWSSVTAPDLQGYVLNLTAAGADAIGRTLAASSIAITGLSPDTEYDASVRAIDTAGNLSVPATARFRTFADVAPAAPQSVLAEDAATGGAIDVSWTAGDSVVPVSRYRVDCTPLLPGWPSRSIETESSGAHVDGLVNELAYRVSVVAITPWDRVSEPGVAPNVTPTAPVKELPLIDATDDFTDAAGVDVTFSIEAEKRELRLQYRALGTALSVRIDDVSIVTLPDTAGAWTDASIAIEKRLLKSSASHVLSLRSAAFADPLAKLSIRNADFVPMAPRGTGLEEFNTVVDVTWRWDEWREDLTVSLTRDGVPVACTAPQLGRCRDTFLENDRKSVWTLRIVSPAGWVSDAVESRGHAKFDDVPPPVTDVSIAADGATLSWTPLSSAASKDAKPAAVRAYRVYAAGAFVSEVSAPFAVVKDADPRVIVVRAVDAEGRESQ